MSLYFDTFGERLIDIPPKCDQTSAAMAEADAEEQKAEAQHRANVNTAVTAAALVFAGAVSQEARRRRSQRPKRADP